MTRRKRSVQELVLQELNRTAAKAGAVLAGLGLAIILFAGSASAQSPKLALAPPMGWNTLYAFGCHDTEAQVHAAAKAMVSNGMKAARYEYVNLDDCWQGKRGLHGNIHPNSRFPHMKALGDYIHSLGLKFGIYSSPGPKTCGVYPGSYGHEVQDAETYAKCGVDLLKYDWCSAGEVYKPDSLCQIDRRLKAPRYIGSFHHSRRVGNAFQI